MADPESSRRQQHAANLRPLSVPATSPAATGSPRQSPPSPLPRTEQHPLAAAHLARAEGDRATGARASVGGRFALHPSAGDLRLLSKPVRLTDSPSGGRSGRSSASPLPRTEQHTLPTARLPRTDGRGPVFLRRARGGVVPAVPKRASRVVVLGARVGRTEASRG